MEAKVTWKQRMSFTGESGSGFAIPLGTSPESGGDDDGMRPMELLLVGLAGCTAMDVISILAKKRQDVKSFEVKVNASRADEHPRIFKDIQLEFIVKGHAIDPAAVERAVELSATKYCSAQAVIARSANITHKITVEEV
jgi:putative redox protein